MTDDGSRTGEQPPMREAITDSQVLNAEKRLETVWAGIESHDDAIATEKSADQPDENEIAALERGRATLESARGKTVLEVNDKLLAQHNRLVPELEKRQEEIDNLRREEKRLRSKFDDEVENVLSAHPELEGKDWDKTFDESGLDASALTETEAKTAEAEEAYDDIEEKQNDSLDRADKLRHNHLDLLQAEAKGLAESDGKTINPMTEEEAKKYQ